MHEKYEAPKITEIGVLADMTQGTSHGNRLDQSVPSQTPVTDIGAFTASHLS